MPSQRIVYIVFYRTGHYALWLRFSSALTLVFVNRYKDFFPFFFFLARNDVSTYWCWNIQEVKTEIWIIFSFFFGLYSWLRWTFFVFYVGMMYNTMTVVNVGRTKYLILLIDTDIHKSSSCANLKGVYRSFLFAWLYSVQYPAGSYVNIFGDCMYSNHIYYLGQPNMTRT